MVAEQLRFDFDVPAVTSKVCKGCAKELPLTEYYVYSSGKLYSKCKTCIHDRSQIWIQANKQRKSQTNMAYRAANREKIRAHKKSQYEQNKESVKARVRAYAQKNRDIVLQRLKNRHAKTRHIVNPQRVKQYHENRDQMLTHAREWRRANKDKIQEQRRRYYEENLAREHKQHREWGQKNPEKNVNYANVRRTRLTGNGGEYSTKDAQRLFRRFNGLCAYCRDRPAKTLDHVIPVSRGGTSFIGNLLPACKPCNSSKKNRTLMEWRMKNLGRIRNEGVSEIGRAIGTWPAGVGMRRRSDPVKIMDAAP